jgi:hypothetical protein
MKKNTVIIALIGGPGSGKSRTAFRLTADLKDLGVDVELVTEFAKDLTWEQNWNALGNQMYITGCQHHREFILEGQVDVIVTDSPIILGPLYFEGETNRHNYETLVNGLYQSKNVQTILLNRTGPYNTNGRTQSEDGAKVIDNNIKNYMDKFEIPYTVMDKTHVLNHVLTKVLNLKDSL